MATTTKPFLDGLTFGEGPRWREGRLWYSDFFTTTVWSATPDGTAARPEMRVDGHPSGIGWLPDGRLLAVSMTGRSVLRREPGGMTTTHADLRPFVTQRANDMLVHPDGHAYVGHFGFDLEAFFDGVASPEPATLLRVARDGRVEVAAEGLKFPNGMALIGSTLVVAETFGMRLSAFDVADGGELTHRRVWATVEGCFPDGICADDAGAVWVANGAAPECLRVAEGGRVLERVVTTQACFACVLGGEDGRTLFCFTAPTSRAGPRSRSHEARVEVAAVAVPAVARTVEA